MSVAKIAKYKEMQTIFTTSSLLAVYHFNSLNVKEWDHIRHLMDAKDIKIKVVHSKITQKALEGTAFSNMNLLFQGSTAISYSNDATVLPHLLAITKIEPKLHLLGGIIDNELLTPLSMINIAKLPEKWVLYQQLINTIQMSSVVLTNLLDATPRRLVQLLERVK